MSEFPEPRFVLRAIAKQARFRDAGWVMHLPPAMLTVQVAATGSVHRLEAIPSRANGSSCARLRHPPVCRRTWDEQL